jgi:hypothetical protein
VSPIRIAVILSLTIPAFTGTVAAQNVGQSDLCALEARSTSAVMTATAQVQAEVNPLKRNELGQAAIAIVNGAYRARLDFFGAKYDVLNSGEVYNMEGSRPFTGFTGKIASFFVYPGSSSFRLSLVLDCPQPQPVVLAAQVDSPTTTQWISNVIALREALLQIKVGSVVEFSGTIFVLVNPRSPMIDEHETVYWMKVIALKNRLSGAIDGETQATATRPQQRQLDGPQGPSDRSCREWEYYDTGSGVCLMRPN